jgi:hypothetical protein
MTAALRPLGRRLDALDIALIVVFLLGLYMGVSLQVTEKIPLTCAPSTASSRRIWPACWSCSHSISAR